MKWFYCLVLVWSVVISQGQSVSEFEGRHFKVFDTQSTVRRDELLRASVDIDVKRYCPFDRAYALITIGKMTFKQNLDVTIRPAPFTNDKYVLELAGFTGFAPVSEIYIISRCHPAWETITVLTI